MRRSQDVVVAAPMSFAGSAARLWRFARYPAGGGWQAAARIGTGFLAVMAIMFTWMLILAWYCMWGLLLVPYRLVRRGQRREKRDRLRHEETLRALRGR